MKPRLLVKNIPVNEIIDCSLQLMSESLCYGGNRGAFTSFLASFLNSSFYKNTHFPVLFEFLFSMEMNM